MLKDEGCCPGVQALSRSLKTFVHCYWSRVDFNEETQQPQKGGLEVASTRNKAASFGPFTDHVHI